MDKEIEMAKNLFNAFRKVKIENTLYAGGKRNILK